MKLDLYMPTEVISGQGCVKRNSEKLAVGKRAFIVTGRSSARLSGAIDDVVSVLEGQGVEYFIFDKIFENPTLDICYDGGRAAKGFGADFVIGIGGGSPLDAAKSIAAFAANGDTQPMRLYEPLRMPSLPIIAIPTTAGTGSEVNPYAVMTLDGEGVKRTFNSRHSYPRTAFLDAGYTLSLDTNYTISCALDALCHCIESYLSPKSTPVSEAVAAQGAERLYKAILRAEAGDSGYELREELMYGAAMGGFAINTTGTGFPHPCGYNLSLFEGVPHGRACAVFYGEYLRLNESAAPERCGRLYEIMGVSGEELRREIPRLSGVRSVHTSGELREYAEKVKDAGNFKNSFHTVGGVDEIVRIYEASLGVV